MTLATFVIVTGVETKMSDVAMTTCIVATLIGAVTVMSIVTLTKVVTLMVWNCTSSQTVIRALPSFLDYCWLSHYNSSTSMS